MELGTKRRWLIETLLALGMVEGTDFYLHDERDDHFLILKPQSAHDYEYQFHFDNHGNLVDKGTYPCNPLSSFLTARNDPRASSTCSCPPCTC